MKKKKNEYVLSARGDYRNLPIDGFRGKYVFNLKNPDEIVNLDYYGTGRKSRCKVTIDSTGHKMVGLTSESGNHKCIRISHIIWTFHYGEIPAGYVIHHRDGDPGNNCIDNLELLDTSAHCSAHNYEKWKAGVFKGQGKKVVRIWPLNMHRNQDVYESITEAASKTGVSLSSISLCCNGKQKTAGRTRWRFAN